MTELLEQAYDGMSPMLRETFAALERAAQAPATSESARSWCSATAEALRRFQGWFRMRLQRNRWTCLERSERRPDLRQHFDLLRREDEALERNLDTLARRLRRCGRTIPRAGQRRDWLEETRSIRSALLAWSQCLRQHERAIEQGVAESDEGGIDGSRSLTVGR